MSSSYFEIIELATGELILKRKDEDQEPLIKVVFSDEAKAFLGDYASEVGRAMIGTGIQLAGKLYDQDVHHDDENQILH
ncbi:MAG: hypothetical protein COB51_04540 [Moraxellaceae bacterium]|nr:MAG: hypothetical protein COB51_04540 [Moraxellaceae bacterium]